MMFDGNPVATANIDVARVGVAVHVDPSRSVFSVQITSTMDSLPSVLVSGLWLSASVHAPSGPIRASISIDGGPASALGSFGTIGPETQVDVLAPAVSLHADHGDQSVGLVTITEHAPGRVGTVPQSKVRLHLVDMSRLDRRPAHRFARPPVMVVVAGDLKLAGPSGSGATAATGIVRVSDPTIAEWVVVSPSTFKSVIEVRGSDRTGSPLPAGPANGPRIDAVGTPGSLGVLVEVLDPAGSPIASYGPTLVALIARPS